MLDNMLPPHISRKLADAQSTNNTGALIASTEPNVTVLFCDILDFHQIGPSHRFDALTAPPTVSHHGV